MVEHQPAAGERQPRSASGRQPGSRPPARTARSSSPALGGAAATWLAMSVFALVGAGIVFKLIQSVQDRRGFAIVLEIAFALVWMFIAAACYQDLKKRRRPTS